MLSRKMKGELDIEAKNKIMALRNVLLVDYFFEDWDIFEKVVLSLNDIPTDFSSIQLIDPSHIAFALGQVKSLRPKMKLSNEVKASIAARCSEAGLLLLTGELAVAKDMMIKLHVGISELIEKCSVAIKKYVKAP